MISASALRTRRRVPLLARKQCRDGRLPSSWFHASRPAFTLTELLVVITIIGMLAGMTLGALFSARETARVAKTQATIAKLDVIVQAKYAELLSRRLPITNRRIPPDAMAELKLRIAREIIRMEMPDRLTDITYPRKGTDVVATDIDAPLVVEASYVVGNDRLTKMSVSETIRRTALANRFFRQAIDNTSFLTGPDPNYAPAECLYLFVAADPEAREQFQPNEIGDADGDGMFEFHDAWDRPIMFLRWAPGFISEMQSGDPVKDHDPLDQRRVGDIIKDNSGKYYRPSDEKAFRLVPLIYSAGPDGKYGINIAGTWVFEYVADHPISRLYDHTSVDGLKIGEPIKNPTHEEYNTHHDNITNHSLGMN